MSTLLSITEPREFQFEEKKKEKTKPFGDIIAVTLLGSYTLSALVIGFWSFMVVMTGTSIEDCPVGLVFDLIRTSGVV